MDLIDHFSELEKKKLYRSRRFGIAFNIKNNKFSKKYLNNALPKLGPLPNNNLDDLDISDNEWVTMSKSDKIQYLDNELDTYRSK